jgi:predicted adenine nucleotide alpha hydrolase (AANH) superfamily ATPase
LTQVKRRAAETGISINTMKTNVLKSNTKTRADLTVNGQNLEEVDSITYIGSEVDKLGGSDKDVKIRIGKARTAFNMMGSI